MNKQARIFVAGHRGLVGSAIVRRLHALGYENLLLRTRAELDLCEQTAVRQFFAAERPEYVFLAAAKVGGIWANHTQPAQFLHDNLVIQSNIIDAAYRNNVQKLLFLGSSCIYPKHCPQPMKESYLLSGALEPTNEAYAIAKIAGLKMCRAYNVQYGTNYLAVMPTNLYGPNDNFDLQSSHVLPALMRKFHEAKESGTPSVEVWGTGSPLREFLHVDDLAEACVYLMEHHDAAQIGEFINVGTGQEISIADLARLIREVVGYPGDIHFNSEKPDGTPRKVLDVSALAQLGWQAQRTLADGVRTTYEWFLQNRRQS
jgi:GDP-L-fucose synthase